MKKIALFAAAFAMLSLASCGNKQSENTETIIESAEIVVEESTAESIVEETAVVVEEVAEPAPAPAKAKTKNNKKTTAAPANDKAPAAAEAKPQTTVEKVVTAAQEAGAEVRQQTTGAKKMKK